MPANARVAATVASQRLICDAGIALLCGTLY
jgi:hypothetical protein